jgi:hypothetical protein
MQRDAPDHVGPVGARHEMMRGLPDRQSPLVVANCDVPVVRRSRDSITFTLLWQSQPLQTRSARSDECCVQRQGALKTQQPLLLTRLRTLGDSGQYGCLVEGVRHHPVRLDSQVDDVAPAAG